MLGLWEEKKVKIRRKDVSNMLHLLKMTALKKLQLDPGNSYIRARLVAVSETESCDWQGKPTGLRSASCCQKADDGHEGDGIWM